MLLVERLAQPAASVFGLRKGTDTAFAQVRHKRQKDLRRGAGVAQSRMSAGDVHPQPGGDGFQREIRKLRVNEFRQQPRVERARLLPCKSGPALFAAQDGKIETDRMTDDRATIDEPLQHRMRIFKPGRLAHHGVGDLVNGGGGRRDRFSGIDQKVEHRVVNHISQTQLHRADLHDSGPRRVKTGRLRVQHDRIKRQKRRSTGWVHHTPSP